LLGQLADDEAAALEEKYFIDRAFFLRVQAVEQGLIEDYLENRLPRSERAQFESRYLTVPALRQRLEEVRARWAPSPPAPKAAGWWAWRVAFAAAAICVVGLAAWLYVHQHGARPPVVTEAQHPQNPGSRPRTAGTPAQVPPNTGAVPPLVAKAGHPGDHGSLRSATGPRVKAPSDKGTPPPVLQALPPQDFSSLAQLGGPAQTVPTGGTAPPVVAQTEHPPDLNVLTVNLGFRGLRDVPPGRHLGGLHKNTSNEIGEFQLPPAGGAIKFLIGLPYEASTSVYTPQLLVLGADGRWNKVWSSDQTVTSVPMNDRQEVTVVLDSSLFHPGVHYALQLMRPNMPVSEYYSFHVTGPR
jgi:hypothetical protein